VLSERWPWYTASAIPAEADGMISSLEREIGRFCSVFDGIALVFFL
jgi:hypothetical protein